MKIESNDVTKGIPKTKTAGKSSAWLMMFYSSFIPNAGKLYD